MKALSVSACVLVSLLSACDGDEPAALKLLETLGADPPQTETGERASEETDGASERELGGAPRAGVEDGTPARALGNRWFSERFGEHQEQRPDAHDENRRTSEQRVHGFTCCG